MSGIFSKANIPLVHLTKGELVLGQKEICISVVITAYNRRRFLLKAVKSVLEQTDTNHICDIIVIKNFVDDTIDSQLLRNSVKVINAGSGGAGEYLLLGARASSGDLIAFLDDDDYFYPTKIERVIQCFKNDPKLTYYHNGVVRAFEDGRTARNPLYSKKGKNIIHTYSCNDSKSVANIINNNSLINISAVVIKRETLENSSIEINNITEATDYFVFYTALGYGGSIMIDETLQSAYTLHHGQSKPEGGIGEFQKKMKALARGQIITHLFGISLSNDLQVKRSIEAHIAQWRFVETLQDGSAKDLLKSYIDFLRASKSRKQLYKIGFLFVLTVRLFSPSMALNIFRGLQNLG
jgi:glycosyltransferase involved in cell wall biosynthesis